jgi:flagellar motor switch protein FliM
VNAAAVTPASLLKAQAEDGGFAEIERVGERLGRGLQELLSASSGHAICVKPGSVNVASYNEWRIAQNPFGMLLRYQLTAQNGQMLVHVPGILVSQIVDLAYGGNGNLAIRQAFTPAETRFTERFAEALVPVIRAAWGDAPGVAPMLSGVECDLLNASWAKTQDRILTNNLSIEGSGIKPATICWIIAAETAKMVPSAHSGGEPTLPDPVWHQRMKASAMAVRLPARSVLTRCDLPLTRLLNLAPGDIIPVFLPATIPLTVAGRTFAHGSIGEANGRAALRIETMEKGFDL